MFALKERILFHKGAKIENDLAKYKLQLVWNGYVDYTRKWLMKE
jgi:hypothetical protein